MWIESWFSLKNEQIKNKNLKEDTKLCKVTTNTSSSASASTASLPRFSPSLLMRLPAVPSLVESPAHLIWSSKPKQNPGPEVRLSGSELISTLRQGHSQFRQHSHTFWLQPKNSAGKKQLRTEGVWVSSLCNKPIKGGWSRRRKGRGRGGDSEQKQQVLLIQLFMSEINRDVFLHFGEWELEFVEIGSWST